MRLAFRLLLGFSVSALSSVLAAMLAWVSAAWLAGPNVSDVGVRMHAVGRGALAFDGGVSIYLVLAALGLGIASRIARVSPPTLWASVAAAALVFLGLVGLLFLQYA